jgi:hypothetical protein
MKARKQLSLEELFLRYPQLRAAADAEARQEQGGSQSAESRRAPAEPVCPNRAEA